MSRTVVSLGSFIGLLLSVTQGIDQPLRDSHRTLLVIFREEAKIGFFLNLEFLSTVADVRPSECSDLMRPKAGGEKASEQETFGR